MRRRARKGLIATTARNGARASGHRPAEPRERADDRRRHQHRDEKRRHGVREEILYEFDVMGRHPHQVAGTAADEVRRREPVQLVEQRDAHLGEHAKRHVVRAPRLEPVQHAGEGRDDREDDQVRRERLAPLHRGHGERARHPDADQGRHPDDPQHQDDRELGLPRYDVAQQFAEHAGPAHALGAQDRVGRFAVRTGVVELQVLEGNLPRDRTAVGRHRQGSVGSRAFLGLGAHQPEIRATRTHERFVVPRLDDGPLVEHQDTVRPDHARQPVREYQRRAALHQPVEGGLDDRLVLRVHRGERLVQDQDRRVAEQGAGNRDPLALPAGELDATLTDDRGVALRQPRDELVRVRGARGRLDLLRGGFGLAEAQVVLDAAVEQVGVLVHHRDVGVDIVRAQVAQIVPADPDGAVIRIVEAQEQAHDGGLSRPALPDEADPFPGLDAELEPSVRGTPSARVGKRHVIEFHDRGERCVEVDRRRWRFDRRPRIEQREDIVRRGTAHHAVVQQRPQIALRAEHLDAHHQHDEQQLETHLALGYAPGPESEHRGRAHRDTGVSEPPAERVGGEHPHRAPKHLVRTFGQEPPARGAPTERLERGKPLDRIEKLRCEGAVRLGPAHAALRLMVLERRRREQREHGEAEHQCGNRQVVEGQHREDDERRDRGYQELRQVPTEVGLELFDPVDHRDHDGPGPLQSEVGGTQRDYLGVQLLAQGQLHPDRGAMRDHRARVLHPAA